MTSYYFLPDDFDSLQKQIHKIRERIKAIGKEMGESCSEGAETFHDNFAYEDGERQQFMWSRRLNELLHIRQNAQLFKPGENRGRVRLGCRVTFADDKTDAEKTIRIGSYLNFSDDRAVSYNAPIARALMGRKQGDLCEAEICGAKKRLEILEIF